MTEVPQRLQQVVDLFLAGKLEGLNHARHVAVARILQHYPYGKELMHLGLQISSTRAGVPEKYSQEITDRCWAELPAGLPEESEFEGGS